MWVMGFALAGVEWAVKEADTPEFKQRMREQIAWANHLAIEPDYSI
jgi:hypothetical protein